MSIFGGVKMHNSSCKYMNTKEKGDWYWVSLPIEVYNARIKNKRKKRDAYLNRDLRPWRKAKEMLSGE